MPFISRADKFPFSHYQVPVQKSIDLIEIWISQFNLSLLKFHFVTVFQVFWGRNWTLTSLTTVIWMTITKITKQKMKKRWMSIHPQRKGPSVPAVTMPHFPTVWKWLQIKFQVTVLVTQDRVAFSATTPHKNLVWRGRKITIVKVEYPLRCSTQTKFKPFQQCQWKTRSFTCFKKTFHRH